MSRPVIVVPEGLRKLRRALAASDGTAARLALTGLDKEEQALAASLHGEDDWGQVLRKASRPALPRKRGRVVLLPGLMGSNLDSIDAQGGADRIWFNFWRILSGRMRELELAPDGGPVDPDVVIRASGLYETYYLSMFLELEEQWETRAFVYDWRLDIDRVARELASFVAAWGDGPPVHFVAHAMGGLVVRRMTQLAPATWRTACGRLILLGTPNQGTYVTPQALTGDYGLIRFVAAIDLPHFKSTELRIFNTFRSTYHCLPAPWLEFGDDTARLYDSSVYGDSPVRQPLLDQARAFHEALRTAVDPERMVFIAGNGLATACGITIESPGRFLYGTTIEGDGTVPHATSLLAGVTTYHLREKHIGLCQNETVQAAVHEILLTGTTTTLPVLAPPPSARAAAAATRSLAGAPAGPAGRDLSPAELALAAELKRAGTAPGGDSGALLRLESAVFRSTME